MLWIILGYVWVAVFISLPLASRVFKRDGMREHGNTYEMGRKEAAAVWSMIWPLLWIIFAFIWTQNKIKSSKILHNYFFGKD